MKNKFIQLLFIVLTGIIVSCNAKKQIENSDVFYTCSMDPQVVENKPGNCPICKMPLTPAKKSNVKDNGELKLSEQQVQLGHITVDTVRKQVLGKELFLTGMLSENQNKAQIISSRVMGRIEKLYFKSIGDKIRIGDPIYEIYSEEINLTLKELKLAYEKKTIGNNSVDIDRIIFATKAKLILYGLNDSDIDSYTKKEIIPETIIIKSKLQGVISDVAIKEGNYVMDGGDVFRLADYSSFWAEAQVYSEDLPKIINVKNATVTVPEFLGMEFSGKIEFVNPELNASSKINLIRVEIPNKNNQLVAGMQVNFSILLNEYVALALPTDAIIFDAKGATVWLNTAPIPLKTQWYIPAKNQKGLQKLLMD